MKKKRRVSFFLCLAGAVIVFAGGSITGPGCGPLGLLMMLAGCSLIAAYG